MLHYQDCFSSVGVESLNLVKTKKTVIPLGSLSVPFHKQLVNYLLWFKTIAFKKFESKS